MRAPGSVRCGCRADRSRARRDDARLKRGPSYVREARRRVGPKAQRIRPIIERLAAAHPDATIALRFRSDLELLVSVVLSAQTTDVTVNRVTDRLFRKYRRPEDYLSVPLEELERDIKPTGTFRQKARNLRGAMRMLLEEFGGEVPPGSTSSSGCRAWGGRRRTSSPPSAGRRRGSLSDTHVRRLSQRLGFTKEEDPAKIERDFVVSFLARIGPDSRISSSGTDAVFASRVALGAIGAS